VEDEGHNYYATLKGWDIILICLIGSFFVYYINSKEFAATGNRNKDGVLYSRQVTMQ
jgi:hypothetical protein